MNQLSLICTTGLKTDVGRQRRLNEDAADVFTLAHAQTAWVVCDGMGGLRAGDVAAGEAVRVVRAELQEAFQNGVPAQPLDVLSQALQAANDAVNRIGAPSPSDDAPTEAPADAPRGAPPPAMGTTCVAGFIVGDTLYLTHAGDSRAYLWQRGHLTRLTEDHSFVAERVRAGDMTEAEAKISRFRNIVTRAIGIDKTVEPETQSLTLSPGDQLLVCSDGLTTVLPDDEIAQVMNRPAHLKGSPEKLASALVEAANQKGGPDNITVLAVRVEDAEGSQGESGRRAASRILDIDAPRPRPRKGSSGWGMLLLGTLLGMGLAAALYTVSPSVRARANGLTTAPPPRTTSRVGGTAAPLDPSAPDFAHLVYDAPRPFASYWALGDKLTYSPRIGLYFVTGSSGKVAYLNKAGQAVATVETLVVPDKTVSTPPTDADVQMTSDPQGNVYFSYAKAREITKVSPDSKVLAVVRGFERPGAIAVDENGNLYVVDNITIKVCRAHLPTPTPEATPTPAPSPKAKPKTKPTP